MPDSHRIASRDGAPFNFSDGLKVRGVALDGDSGGTIIKVKIKDTDATPTDLYTWARATAASVATLQTNSTTATTAANQAAGNNSTLIANTAFVTTAVANAVSALVGAAPASLNSLQELAAAIGNDAAYSVTVNTALATKAPITDVQQFTYSTAAAAASSTVDAISAVFTPAVALPLKLGHVFKVRTKGTNTAGNPTFTPNSGIVPIKTVVKGAGVSLVAGDIGIIAELQYDPTLDAWVLLNPNTPGFMSVASTASAGVVLLATNAQGTAGTDTSKAMTPASTAAAIAAAVSSATVTFRAPSVSLSGKVGHEKGMPLSVTLSAVNITPDTSISRFEYTVGDMQTVSVSASLNSATFDIPAAVTDSKVLGSSYLLTVVAYGNTGSKSPATVVPINIIGVNTPSITFPTYGQANISLTPTITSSAFGITTLAGDSDTHALTVWEILDETTGATIWTVTSPTSKTAATVPANVLTQGKMYRTRVRYVGTKYTHMSDWSAQSYFTTTQTTSISSRQMLTPASPDNAGNFGVALDMCGNVCVIGAPLWGSYEGEIEVRTRASILGAWNAPVVLRPPMDPDTPWPANSSMYGAAVCCSDNGNRAVFVAPHWNAGQGFLQVWNFAPTLSLFSTINGSGASDLQAVNCSVACNADASLIAVGQPMARSVDTTSPLLGIVDIYRFVSGTTYIRDAQLVANDTTTQSFGRCVAMSPDGLFMAVTSTSGSLTGSGIAKLFIYKRQLLSWQLVKTMNVDSRQYGPMPVKFSSSFKRLVMGASNAMNGNGLVYVLDYVSNSDEWVVSTILNDTSASNAGALLGSSVDVSRDGHMIAAGAPSASYDGYGLLGKVCVWRETFGGWVQDAVDVTPPVDSRGNGLYYGYAVSIGDNNNEIIVSAPWAWQGIPGRSSYVQHVSL
jgi:hypothetical protein